MSRAGTCTWAEWVQVFLLAQVRSQTRDELSHDLRRWSWLSGERYALPGPHGESFDVTSGANHRRRWLVADDSFARGEMGDDIADSGATLQRRPARGLPHLGRRVAKGAVG